MDAARTTEKDYDMATIGSFTASGNGFSGTIKTLNLNVKATIRAVERTSEKGPDYRILAGATEFGAGWKKTSNEGRDYLSVKLDDPSFPAPIYATLIEVEGEEGLSLKSPALSTIDWRPEIVIDGGSRAPSNLPPQRSLLLLSEAAIRRI
ncbi:hypothetical protein Rleg9DRAFT_6087 [Rhizobium leguminosarum bv. trifolii WSM597]|uniref:DUF736 domain-containing protein n=1 Tax=Rhizobium leguminosarum bv. trifolii WSM597 TaxID=754764 RepID=I9NGL3_RHILT|nr:hypothetical protein Rleg9DRAFT_6087 [Rhizobium leguminosarum bv. trifolii WSM597]